MPDENSAKCSILVSRPVSIMEMICADPEAFPSMPAFQSFQPVAVEVVKVPLFWRTMGIVAGLELEARSLG